MGRPIRCKRSHYHLCLGAEGAEQVYLQERPVPHVGIWYLPRQQKGPERAIPAVGVLAQRDRLYRGIRPCCLLCLEEFCHQDFVYVLTSNIILHFASAFKYETELPVQANGPPVGGEHAQRDLIKVLAGGPIQCISQ